MKKIIAMILALVMCFALVACGGNDDAANNDSADAGFTTAVEGKLYVATNVAFPPYEYYEGTEAVGIDMDIARAIGEKLGLEVVIEDMEFDAINESVKSGKSDVGFGGMTVTEERKEIIDFTVSYATGVQVVIVKEDSAIASVDDLFAEGAMHTIGVQRNTTGDLYTTWDLEDAGLATIDRYSKGADAVQSLVAGKVDCVVIDNEPAKAFVAENEGLKILDTAYALEEYAASVSKDNPELYAAINGALEELIADGTVAAIVEKYIPAA
ncbi:MAG: transporter substrate-binding domain-containing protein [Oscillospiraceae bacterium]|nr:transporter substrate-binding domain-containing protein [Oscillospiraceae bacterium]